MKIVKLIREEGQIEEIEQVPSPIAEFCLAHDHGHRKLLLFEDIDLAFKAFIAVHDTTLGPALGGVRIWNYPDAPDPELAAIRDVLRLSEAMTYKNSAAGLDLGGGKGVLLKPSGFSDNRPAILESFGRFVDYLGGEYITAEDMGATPEDMRNAAKGTRYATGLPEEMEGSGNSSIATAHGIFSGIKASVEFLGLDLKGLTVSVQGACGHVATPLIELLNREGVMLVASDIPARSSELETLKTRYGARVVSGNAIYDAPVHIFSPCAMGAVLNSQTIPRLKAAGVKIVAGAANNQLEDTELHGKMVEEAGILYAPDFVINSGGVINLAHEKVITGRPFSKDEALTEVRKIHDRLLELFKESRSSGIGTARLAVEIAIRRIEEAKKGRGVTK